MQKQAPTTFRLAVIAGFVLLVFGLLLFLWIAFGGSVPFKPEGYRVKVAFPQATQLAKQSDVRVAGVSVGKVVDIQRAPGGNRALATLQLERPYVPLRSNAQAILRLKTLLGETYVQLSLGSPHAKAIPDGGRLADGRVLPTVQLDQLLSIFDPSTRRAFRAWQRNSAQATAGRAQDISNALGDFPQFTTSATSVLDVLDRRQAGLRKLIRNTGTTFAALSQNEGQLQRLITTTRQVFDTTASQRDALAESIRRFPPFLDQSRITLARLRTFALATDPLILNLGPVLRDLRPTLRDLRTLSPNLTHLFRAIPPLIKASERGLPALSHVLRGLSPVLAALGPFTEQLNPILQWIQLNQPITANFLSLPGSALAANYGSTNNPATNGHALPQLIVTGGETTLTSKRTATNRGNAYLGPNALTDPRLQTEFMAPNWDCRPSGGPTTYKPGDPVLGAGGTPACYVQGPITFQGKSQTFSHVNPANYAK